jgi:hypothetical protein
MKRQGFYDPIESTLFNVSVLPAGSNVESIGERPGPCAAAQRQCQGEDAKKKLGFSALSASLR